MVDETNPLQESLERSARLGQILLPSPPLAMSYGLMLLLSAASAVLLGADLEAALRAALLVLAPAVLASLVGSPSARLFGRNFYHRRSALLALAGAAITAAGVAAAVLLGQFGIQAGKVLFVAVGLVWVLRYGIIGVVVENRQHVALSLSLVQPLAALPGLSVAGGSGSLWLGFVLWVVLIVPFVLMVRLFDTPLQRNFGISASELFRAYLDHVTTQSADAEALMDRLGEPVDARVAVIAFKRKDGSRKACVAVPCVHPGPFGALGGGDLPQRMRSALSDWEHVLVPHAAANHDLNPVTTHEVERLGHYVAQLASGVETAPGGSRFVEHGETVRLGAQLFGPDALLTYTSWPEALDDVDYGVGRAAELIAEGAGARHAIFADCHNSLRASAGAVFPLTPRALEIERLSREATSSALAGRVPEIRVGLSQDTSLGLGHLIGRAGCQALVVDAGGERTAYVLWDGNNMVPEATKAIRDAVLGVVDQVRVMTTDNHAVNLEGGVYSPVGLRAGHDRLARISRETVQRALADLEPVEAGAAAGHAPGIKVVGHQKTAQLSASVNVMVSQLPELVLACLALWALGIAVVFLAS